MRTRRACFRVERQPMAPILHGIAVPRRVPPSTPTRSAQRSPEMVFPAMTISVPPRRLFLSKQDGVRNPLHECCVPRAPSSLPHACRHIQLREVAVAILIRRCKLRQATTTTSTSPSPPPLPGPLRAGVGCRLPLPLTHLAGPALDALAAGPGLEPLDADAAHSRRVVEPRVRRHASGVRTLLGHELEHGLEEVRDAPRLVGVEVVLLAQDVRERPVPQPVDVPELALAVEDLLRPLPLERERFGKRAEKLDDLRDMVVVLAVLGARLWVEEIVACDELENLPRELEIYACRLA